MSNFVIRKNQVNNIALTVRERSLLVDPYYLVAFKNKFSTATVETVTSVQNGVADNDRYELFVIEEKVAPNNLLGEVQLRVGEWSYDIYESQLQTLLVAETTGRILQSGFIIVKE